MEQSVSRRSRAGLVVKIAVAMLIGVAGLTVVGVDAAFAVAGPPTVTGLAKGLNGTGVCTAGVGYGGDSSGGVEIAVCGTDFGALDNTSTSVTVGGAPATVVEVVSNSRLYVDVPPAASSTAAEDVIVTNPLLTTSTTSTCVANPGCVYTYTWQPPTVAAVGLTPVTATNQVSGSTTVTISAAGTWTTGQEVSLAGFSNHLTTGIYTITAGGSGSFNVTFDGITTGSGPGVVSPTPAGGVGPTAGGNHAIISGTNLAGTTSVLFGSNAATYTVNSATQITATVPASTGGATGPVDVTVTNPNSTSSVTPLTDTYSYIGTPTVTGVTTVANPAGGPTGGGTSVTVTGTGFNNVSAVKFGTAPATSFLTNSLDSITAVAPAGTGTQDITVTTSLGTSTVTSADEYTYNGTLTAVGGTASYSSSPGTDVPATATSQAGGAGTPVTVDAIGSWSAGTEVVLSGFTNGLTAGTYTITSSPGLGSFIIPFAGTTSGSGTGTVLIPNTATTSSVTATAQAGSSVTVTSSGTWYAGEQLYLTGFTNGLSGNYTVTAGGSNSFTITGTTTGTGTGTIVPYQVQSFDAATLVTGGTSVGAITVTSQPAAGGGTVSVVGDQLLYTPAQPPPTSYTTGSGATETTTWLTSVSTTGTQTATFQVCEATPNTGTCTSATMTYLVSATGFYVGNQLSAAGQIDTVVEDTGSASVISNSTPGPGSTFTSTVAPPSTVLPASNSGFTLTGIGGYRSITPVPSGISLVPGSLSVSGGDTASSGEYTVTYCTAAMGFVAGTCTANNATNFNTPYPYIETSLNVSNLIAGGSQLSLPTINAEWTVTAPVGTQISSMETEFSVVTVVQTIGVLVLDAYPTDLASNLNQGINAPPPTYAAPPARWSATVTNIGPTPPTITSADATTFTEGTAGSFTVTTQGDPTPAISETGQTLPSGVTFVDNGDGTATLAGTPAAGTAGTYTITIKAANGNLPDATQTFTLTVNQPAAAPAITSADSTSFAVGTAGSFTVTTTGNPAPTVTETGPLPTGVTFVGNSGGTATLSGTPAAGTGGSYPITITANNGVTPNATQSFTLSVDQAPAITSADADTFKVATAGSFTVTTTGTPTAAITETGSLPTGVALVDNGNGTATLSGTPAAATGGTYAITITANNGVSPNATQSFTLTVDQAPSITSADTTTFVIGTAGSFQVTASGFPASTFTETGALPGGVTLSNSGLLSDHRIQSFVPDHYHCRQWDHPERHPVVHAGYPDCRRSTDDHVGRHHRLHRRIPRDLHRDGHRGPCPDVQRDGPSARWCDPQLCRCPFRHPGRRLERYVPHRHHSCQRDLSQRDPGLQPGGHERHGPDDYFGPGNDLHGRFARQLYGHDHRESVGGNHRDGFASVRSDAGEQR
jgi:large repetitive protein